MPLRRGVTAWSSCPHRWAKEREEFARLDLEVGLLWYMFDRRPALLRASATSASRSWLLGGLLVLVMTMTAFVLFLPSS